MELSAIERIVAEARSDGVDPRLAHARVRRVDGGVWIEATDPAWLEAAIAGVARAGLTGARGRVLDAPRDRVAWVAASVAEVRREPRHAAEQVTQVLQGEALQPLVHEDGWLLARLPDGYIGWVRDWHLRFADPAAVATHAARADARIDADRVALRAAPHRAAPVAGESLLGTRVVTRGDERGWTRIELPAGRTGWVPRTALREGRADWPADAAAILATVRRFVGVPYLWGGRSPKGFDCSGLVQFVFGLHGIALPRDSDQQAGCGAAVTAETAGDLVFFGRDRVTHVAVATGEETFLHARGEVRCNSTVAGTPLYDAELWAMRCAIRRVLPPSEARPAG